MRVALSGGLGPTGQRSRSEAGRRAGEFTGAWGGEKRRSTAMREAVYQPKVTYHTWEPALGPLRRTSARAGSGLDTEARKRQGWWPFGGLQVSLPCAESGPVAAA